MRRNPIPGTSVRGSRTGRPVMALLDLLGRRWALRVVWELRERTLTSRALREACGGVSPTVLSDRLRELREAGMLVRVEPAGYALTPLGRELLSELTPLARWAARWAASLRLTAPRPASRRRPSPRTPSRL